MRYTPQQRADALRQLRANDNNINAVSEKTGIHVKTLRKWRYQHESERAERLLTRLQQLEEDLIENTLQIVESLNDVIENAPLNQRTSAIGTLVDRYLKVNEHLREIADNQTEENDEKVIRIEYVDPDGSTHDTPYWTRADFTGGSTLQSDSLRETLREDLRGQDSHLRERDEREDLLVAGTDHSNGGASVARPEEESTPSAERTYHYQ